MLCGSDFVMFRFREYAEFPKLFVQLLHECGNAGLDCAEVVVVKLLSLGCSCSEKCSSGVDEVLALVVHFFVNKEVFLLRTYGCFYRCNVLVTEQLQYAECLTVYLFH